MPRLRTWVADHKLPINSCGKVIVPQKEDLDGQLDVLADRGIANGATVEFWDTQQLHEWMPEARSASGRALWSPNTAVVKPLKVVQTLQQELQDHGVSFKCADSGWLADPDRRQIRLAKGETISYGHLINCAGLQADRVAHSFGVGLDYTLLPFKGMYWQLKPDCPIQPRSNLYPVPDLNVPFWCAFHSKCR